MTPADILAFAALKMPKDHPVSEAIGRVRAGEGAQLASVNPLILVDTIRTLAILGEDEIVDRAYAEWKALPDGAVHFEAGLAALMGKRLDEAAERFERAVSAARPQPMAWNSLAALHLSRHQVERAREAIEAGVRAMPGDAITLNTATMVRAIHSGRSELPKDKVMLLCERFPAHAQLAREAADLVSRWPEKRALLERRADELDRRLLMGRAEAPQATAGNDFVDCANVTVEAGTRPKVRLRLSVAQQERALAGNILRFTVALPDGPRLVHLQRNDVAPAEPAPAFRLRVIPTMFSDLRLGTITPLFSDVPFTLELSLAPPEVVRSGAAPPEDPSVVAGGTLFAGVFMLGMGALRAALASRPDSTNTFMMLIGAGMLVYGGWRWLQLRFTK